MKKYTWWERVKYARRRKWFCKRYFLDIKIPCIPTDQDIFIDFAWRDIQQKKKKQAKPYLE